MFLFLETVLGLSSYGLYYPEGLFREFTALMRISFRPVPYFLHLFCAFNFAHTSVCLLLCGLCHT